MNTRQLRDEAFETVADLDRRVYSTKALEGTIIRLARHIYDLADRLDLAQEVAHAAWHLLDDSGETDESDDNEAPLHVFFHNDFERLSAALDALEATGWDAHKEDAPS